MKNSAIIKNLNIKTLLFRVFVIVGHYHRIVLGLKSKEESIVLGTYGIPIGLFFMIYPAMTKVILRDFFKSLKDMKSFSLMLFLNYVVDPFLVAALGYFFFISYFII